MPQGQASGLSPTMSPLLPDAQRRFATDLVRRLRAAGFQAYWAGGCVRDRLMGRTPKDYDVATENDYTMWTVPGIHWQIGGAFVIAVVAGLIGLAVYFYCKITRPAYFRGETLTRTTETLAPDV